MSRVPSGVRGALVVGSIVAAVSFAACGGDGSDVSAPPGPTVFEAIPQDPPAAPGSLAPHLAVAAGKLAATWIEPFREPASSSERRLARKGHRLRFSLLSAGGWSDPVTIAEGTNFFANWADVPAVIEGSSGALYAHWLAKTAEDTYAYSIFLALSTDGGASWAPIGKLNSDATPTEHGFVSFVTEESGVRAFWLDGRAMVDGAPMTLRTATVGGVARGAGGTESRGTVSAEEVLDVRVCECCPTAAALTARGPVVAYRDRGESEVRDIGIVRRRGSKWTAPASVAEDGWRINGCPVNGPKLAAEGDRVAVAWFTAVGDLPRVQVAFSDDAAATFDQRHVIDAGEVLGRVGLAMDGAGGVWVTWMASLAEDAIAEIRLQRVLPDGPSGPSQEIARIHAGRTSGVPVLERLGERLYLSWVDVGATPQASRIRISELRAGA